MIRKVADNIFKLEVGQCMQGVLWWFTEPNRNRVCSFCRIFSTASFTFCSILSPGCSVQVRKYVSPSLRSASFPVFRRSLPFLFGPGGLKCHRMPIACGSTSTSTTVHIWNIKCVMSFEFMFPIFPSGNWFSTETERCTMCSDYAFLTFCRHKPGAKSNSVIATTIIICVQSKCCKEDENRFTSS